MDKFKWINLVFRRAYFVIIGDAAHAMVPFYGQGMNAGFEDCTILNQLMEEHGDELDKVLEEFTKKRNQDAHAICDLAMYNYIEVNIGCNLKSFTKSKKPNNKISDIYFQMRDLVNRRSFKLRKQFDDFLFKLMPETWVPLYNSVTFSNMGYAQCIQNRRWQDRVGRFMIQAFII